MSRYKHNTALREILAKKAAIAATKARNERVAKAPAIQVGVLGQSPLTSAGTNNAVNLKEQNTARILEASDLPMAIDNISDMPAVANKVVITESRLAKRLREQREAPVTIDVVKDRREQVTEFKKSEQTLAERLAELKKPEVEERVVLDLPSTLVPNELVLRGKDQITYEDLNGSQKKGVSLADNNQDFCLIGCAGSGKTTTVKMVAETLSQNGHIQEIGKETKVLSATDPSIVFVSFTNQAVSNIREAVPTEFKNNCLTIHKLLEYMPEFFDIVDPVTGEERTTMRYIPARNALNPITGITHVVVEEAGSVGTGLFDNLQAAMPSNVVWIFLGDLNQLPPIFDDAILGFKLIELPVVELTQSYRTDSTSPITELAWKILEGKPMTDAQLDTMTVEGELELVRFKERVPWEKAIPQVGGHFANLVHKELEVAGSGFNPEEDVVLIPFNKQLGSVELNNYIAQAITEINDVPTHEIIVGFIKIYHAVGDIVYQAKNRWRIVDICDNPNYVGKKPNPCSRSLDRWGINKDEEEALLIAHAENQIDLEEQFNQMAKAEMATTNDTQFRQSSHQITLEDMSGEKEPKTISDCAAVNEMYLAYALTVHKSQGSEWGKVFCVFHHSHGVMMKREILYTAFTRARSCLRIYYSGEDTRSMKERKYNDSTFQKGIIKQDIPGDTVTEKLVYFRKKLEAMAMQRELKRIKGTEESMNHENLVVDSAMAKKLLYRMTHSNDNGE